MAVYGGYPGGERTGVCDVTYCPVVVDGNSLIVRSIMLSATDDLEAGGRPTGGVYGSLLSLRGIIDQPTVNAAGVWMFFDAGVPEFRRELVPTYKAERKRKRMGWTPEQERRVFGQIDDARQLFGLLGVGCGSVAGWEADDCVASACRLLHTADGCYPVVVSGDKDLWQLVPDIADAVWDLGRKRLIDDDSFEAAAGVHPRVYRLFRAMVGDPSDGIPGVDGCGVKRAAALVASEVDGPPAPIDQLHRLSDRLMGSTRAYERAVAEQYERVVAALRVADLTAGNRLVDGAVAWALAEPTTVDRVGFLRACKRFDFKRVLGNPERFLGPFEAAVARREEMMTMGGGL